MLMGPPNVLGAPKPISSIRTMTTFGAPLGAFTSKRGGSLRVARVEFLDHFALRLSNGQHRSVQTIAG